MKTVLANTWGELAHKLRCDVDEIYRAWTMATDRLISPKYLKAGMGDGGGCHPRDNIALSFVSRQVGLSFDIFGMLMVARERQTEFIANLVLEQCINKGTKEVVILGKAFKPGTNITTGSPAVLLSCILAEIGVDVMHWDPYVDKEEFSSSRQVFVVATQHPEFKHFGFPQGSVVIDPFRYIDKRKGVTVIQIGKNGTQSFPVQKAKANGKAHAQAAV